MTGAEGRRRVVGEQRIAVLAAVSLLLFDGLWILVADRSATGVTAGGPFPTFLSIVVLVPVLLSVAVLVFRGRDTKDRWGTVASVGATLYSIGILAAYLLGGLGPSSGGGSDLAAFYFPAALFGSSVAVVAASAPWRLPRLPSLAGLALLALPGVFGVLVYLPTPGGNGTVVLVGASLLASAFLLEAGSAGLLPSVGRDPVYPVEETPGDRTPPSGLLGRWGAQPPATFGRTGSVAGEGRVGTSALERNGPVSTQRSLDRLERKLLEWWDELEGQREELVERERELAARARTVVLLELDIARQQDALRPTTGVKPRFPSAPPPASSTLPGPEMPSGPRFPLSGSPDPVTNAPAIRGGNPDRGWRLASVPSPPSVPAPPSLIHEMGPDASPKPARQRAEEARLSEAGPGGPIDPLSPVSLSGASEAPREIPERPRTGLSPLDRLLEGDLPAGHAVALVARSLARADPFVHAFLLRGLLRGDRAIIVTLASPVSEVAESLARADPRFGEYRRSGSVMWVDGSVPQAAAEDDEEHAALEGEAPSYVSVLSRFLSVVRTSYADGDRRLRIVVLGIPAILDRPDYRVGYAFLGSLIGLLRGRNALALLPLTTDVPGRPSIEPVRARADFTILLDPDGDRALAPAEDLPPGEATPRGAAAVP